MHTKIIILLMCLFLFSCSFPKGQTKETPHSLRWRQEQTKKKITKDLNEKSNNDKQVERVDNLQSKFDSIFDFGELNF